mmetsp:Transcript_38285/g.87654  ORF Transcript_38285/g.87654 Transcript_38285/m.87654 type:complete len:445 (+) Transcript_38285:68-1402(+)
MGPTTEIVPYGARRDQRLPHHPPSIGVDATQAQALFDRPRGRSSPRGVDAAPCGRLLRGPDVRVGRGPPHGARRHQPARVHVARVAKVVPASTRGARAVQGAAHAAQLEEAGLHAAKGERRRRLHLVCGQRPRVELELVDVPVEASGRAPRVSAEEERACVLQDGADGGVLAVEQPVDVQPERVALRDRRDVRPPVQRDERVGPQSLAHRLVSVGGRDEELEPSRERLEEERGRSLLVASSLVHHRAPLASRVLPQVHPHLQGEGVSRPGVGGVVADLEHVSAHEASGVAMPANAGAKLRRLLRVVVFAATVEAMRVVKREARHHPAGRGVGGDDFLPAIDADRPRHAEGARACLRERDLLPRVDRLDEPRHQLLLRAHLGQASRPQGVFQTAERACEPGDSVHHPVAPALEGVQPVDQVGARAARAEHPLGRGGLQVLEREAL